MTRRWRLHTHNTTKTMVALLPLLFLTSPGVFGGDMKEQSSNVYYVREKQSEANAGCCGYFLYRNSVEDCSLDDVAFKHYSKEKLDCRICHTSDYLVSVKMEKRFDGTNTAAIRLTSNWCNSLKIQNAPFLYIKHNTLMNGGSGQCVLNTSSTQNDVIPCRSVSSSCILLSYMYLYDLCSREFGSPDSGLDHAEGVANGRVISYGLDPTNDALDDTKPPSFYAQNYTMEPVRVSLFRYSLLLLLLTLFGYAGCRWYSRNAQLRNTRLSTRMYGDLNRGVSTVSRPTSNSSQTTVRVLTGINSSRSPPNRLLFFRNYNNNLYASARHQSSSRVNDNRTIDNENPSDFYEVAEDADFDFEAWIRSLNTDPRLAMQAAKRYGNATSNYPNHIGNDAMVNVVSLPSYQEAVQSSSFVTPSPPPPFAENAPNDDSDIANNMNAAVSGGYDDTTREYSSSSLSLNDNQSPPPYDDLSTAPMSIPLSFFTGRYSEQQGNEDSTSEQSNQSNGAMGVVSSISNDEDGSLCESPLSDVRSDSESISNSAK